MSHTPHIRIATTPLPIPERKRGGAIRAAAPIAYPFASLTVGGAPCLVTFDPSTPDLAKVLKAESTKVFNQVRRFISAHPHFEFTVRTVEVGEGPAHQIGIWRIPADPIARAEAKARRAVARSTPEAIAKRAAKRAAKASLNAAA